MYKSHRIYVTMLFREAFREAQCTLKLDEGQAQTVSSYQH